MNEKRYSVFISSTYEDLKEERKAVQDVILSGGDFPVQMEYFPATDEDQLEFIKPLIEQCDYYVLIIGGRYGSPTADGTSYTEKEFNHAVSKGVTVIVMLHGDPENIPSGKTESTQEGRNKLSKFIRRAEDGRIRKTWTDIAELQLAVSQALTHAKNAKPSTGWVRADKLTNVEALEELDKLRRQNSEFREVIGNLEVELALPPIPAANEKIEIGLLPRPPLGYGTSKATYAKVQTTWIDAFPVFFSNLRWVTNDWGGEYQFSIEVDETRSALGEALAAELADFNTQGLYTVSKSTYERLLSYFVEVGLMLEEGDTPFTPSGARVARRHRISGTSESAFELIDGRISQGRALSIDDDEIPF